MKDKHEIKAKEGTKKYLKWFGIGAGVLMIVFLIGFLPMWIKSRAVSSDLASTRDQLRKCEIRNFLTTALVETNRGEYEAGRKNASAFFSSLRAEYDNYDEGAFTAAERDSLKTVFEARDSTVTMLAQRDQASMQRLTEVYFTYQKVVGSPTQLVPGTVETQPAQPAR